MATKTEKISGVKQHTVYKVKGRRVPGVTTITGVLNKPALLRWANNIGLQGIEMGKYVDKLAEIGTLTHHRIQCEWTGEEPYMDSYSKEQINYSDHGMLKFYEWEKGKKIKPILVEEPLVSEQHRYGGTPDFYGTINGVHELVDIKTGKAIYNDYFIQLAAYKNLLLENEFRPVEQVRILRVGRDESEGFDQKIIPVNDLQKHWELFLLCRQAYELKKELKI